MDQDEQRRIWREVIDCLNATPWYRWYLPEKISPDRSGNIALAVCHDEMQYLKPLAERLRTAVEIAPRDHLHELSVPLRLQRRLKDCPDLPDEDLILMLTQVTEGAVCPSCGNLLAVSETGWHRCPACKGFCEVVQSGNGYASQFRFARRGGWAHDRMTGMNIAGGSVDIVADLLVNRFRFGEPMPDGMTDFLVRTTGGFSFDERHAAALNKAETAEEAEAIVQSTVTIAPTNLNALTPQTRHGKKIRDNLKATRRKSRR